MGNNQINHVDPDGGNALSIALGAGSGAVIGGVTGWAIAKGQGLDKADQWKYAGIGAGIGAVVGGVTGAFFDAKFSFRHGRYGLTNNGLLGLKFTRNGSSHFKNFIGKGDGHIFGKSNMPWSSSIHFSFGIRICNWVLLDIRFNSMNNNKYQVNFPGRWSRNPYSNFRFSMLYFVWPKSKGHYKMFWDSIHWWPCFFGGYTWFQQDPGMRDGVPTLQDHAHKKY